MVVFDNQAKLIEDLLLVIAMTTAEYQPRCAPDITLIFFRPFDYLCVFSAVFQFFDSARAKRAART